MENSDPARVWFPDYDKCAAAPHLSDAVFHDFDQQAEQLAGHQQHYLQLSAGAFAGRFRSVDLGGGVVIHLETCNQALEQDILGSPDHFTLGLTLGPVGGFIAGGQAFGPGHVLLLPPRSHIHIISPAQGAMMAIAIDRAALDAHAQLFLRLPDWLAGLAGHSRVLQRPAFVRRLREDAVDVLALAGGCGRADLAHALLTSLLARLALDCAAGPGDATIPASLGFARFQHCRHWLKTSGATEADPAALTRISQASRRSVELAFARTVAMGPRSYLRLLRLHDIRRCLIQPAAADRSIGDIAAEHGYWDWSHFTRQYRQHFGELPSQTRRSPRPPISW